MHLLAMRISTFLSLKPERVLKHWASAKILRSRPVATGTGKDAELDGDDEVCRLIVEKFKQRGGVNVSYAEIAKRAWGSRQDWAGDQGRVLALYLLEITRHIEGIFQLLDHEQRASDQVPLLLSMKEDRLALQEAVDSDDSDLVMFLN